MANDVKKIPFLILKMLQEKTNLEHHLQQKEIVELLQTEYDIKCNRKTVADNIRMLNDLGYHIEYADGYYIATKQFSDEELRYLIDSVLFSKNLTKKLGETLINKITSLGDEYFQKEIPAVKMIPGGIGHSESNEFLHNVFVLHQAIAKKQKVSFCYAKYGTDLKQHVSEKRHVVSPYYLVAANSHYFLMCSYDNHDNMAVTRVDRIKNIVPLEKKVKPKKEITDYMEASDLPKHLAEHIYMFNGPSSRIKIITTVSMMSDLVDWFGKDIEVGKQEGDNIVVTVKCNEEAMFYWSLQYGKAVEVLSPKSLRKKLLEATKSMYDKYSKR